MSTIRIEWLSDVWNCETCGSNYADGANVFIDDQLALELKPLAACFGGFNYDEREVFTRVLAHLGHEVIAE